MNVKLINLINLGTMPWPLFGEALTQAWIRICRPAGFCSTFSRPLWLLWIKMLNPDTNIHHKYNYREVLFFNFTYYVRSQDCEKGLSTSSCCLSVLPSVHVEQLDSYWTSFHISWYLMIFQKSLERIQVSWKYDKNNGNLLEALRAFIIVSRSVHLTMRNVSDERCKETGNMHFRLKYFFFTKIVPFMTMWKNVDPDRLHMKIRV